MATTNSTTVKPIRLAPGHDLSAYARIFARLRRIHIPGFLNNEDATRLYEALRDKTPWSTTVIHGDYVYDLSEEQQKTMSDEQRAKLEAEVNAFATHQFEGRYGTCRVSDHGEPYDGDVRELTAITKFLNGPAFIDFVRAITGVRTIDFADAQATRYGPGDFLHPHLDYRVEKKRMMAYIINLTPKWKVEWGGLLGFIGPDNHLTEAYTPAWNALNLLDVNELHYVSCVAPFAPHLRYSITGWLRAR